MSNDRELILAYIISEPDSNWDGTYATLASLDTSELIAIVQFKRHYCHFFGPPNDEAFEGHPLASRGLHPYAVNEVKESSWMKLLGSMNSVHRCHRPGYLTEDSHHYIFAFHDSTFECVAVNFQVEIHRDSMKTIVQLMSQKLIAATLHPGE